MVGAQPMPMPMPMQQQMPQMQMQGHHASTHPTHYQQTTPQQQHMMQQHMMQRMPQQQPQQQQQVMPSQPDISGITGLSNKRISTTTTHRMLKSAAAKEVEILLDEEKAKKIAEMGKDEFALSAEEKAQQSKDRNREHARSTRLRKKAYVLKLEELVEQLSSDRTKNEQQQRVTTQRNDEIKKVRARVLTNFLRLIVMGPPVPQAYAALLAPNFVMSSPITPFRSFARHQCCDGIRYIRGISEVVEEGCSMRVMINNIGLHNTRWSLLKLQEFCANFPNLMYQIQQQNYYEISNSPSGDSSSDVGTPPATSNIGSTPPTSDAGATLEEVKPNTHTKKLKKEEKKSKEAEKANSGDAQDSSNSNNGNNSSDSLHNSKMANTTVENTSNSSLDDGSGSDGGRGERGSSEGKESTGSGGSSGGEKFHDYHAPSIPDYPPPEKSPNREGAVSEKVRTQAGQKRSLANSEVADLQQRNTRSKRGGTRDSSRKNVNPSAAKTNETESNSGASNGSWGSGNTMEERLQTAPAIPLPPFVGLGKKASFASKSNSNPSLTNSADFVSNVSAVQPNADTQMRAIPTNPGGVTDLPKTAASTSSSVPAPIQPNVQVRVPPAQDNHMKGVLNSNSRLNSISGLNSVQQTAPLTTPLPGGGTTGIVGQYYFGENDIMSQDNVIMGKWTFNTTNAVALGSLQEVAFSGMLFAKFDANHKMESVDISYDVMQVMQLLQGCQRLSSVMPIMPNSIDMAMSKTAHQEPRLIINCMPPNHIVNVNSAWMNLWGYSQSKTEGKTITEMMTKDYTLNEAHGTNSLAEYQSLAVFKNMLNEVCSNRASNGIVLHYGKNKSAIINYLTCVPLPDKKYGTTHFLIIGHKLNSAEVTKMILESNEQNKDRSAVDYGAALQEVMS
ncbi:hypothetical protein TrLO_g9536 [Triparma laevis f. longispina]|nr:hypothetical protein TrLO_g9536 [Triparma laevis f. longispina]